MRRLPVLAASTAVLLASMGAGSPTQAASTTRETLAAEPGPLVNGDFESGSFVGWSPFVTTNGQMRMAVVSFDTDGDGAATFSAQFVVGQEAVEGRPQVQRGGGVFQEVTLGRGDLDITADIASSNTYGSCNGDAGTVQVLVDGVVADEHGFGDICGPSAKSSSLAANLALTSAGRHEIRLLLTRGALPTDVVRNHIDDVILAGGATVRPVIGSPAATPARPVAGKRLTLSYPVTRSDSGAPLTRGTMSCNALIKGKSIRHSESFANGSARLSLVVPKTAKGKVLTVRLAVTAENDLSAVRAAAFRIR